MRGATIFSIGIFVILLVAGYFVTVNNILPDYFSGGSSEGSSLQPLHSVDVPLLVNGSSYINIGFNSSTNISLYIMNSNQFRNYSGLSLSNISYNKRMVVNITTPPKSEIYFSGSKSTLSTKIFISQQGTYWVSFFNPDSRASIYLSINQLSVTPKG